MEFRIDGLGGDNAYIEAKRWSNHLEIGAGRQPDQQQRAFVTTMNRQQALALADMLRGLAKTLGTPK